MEPVKFEVYQSETTWYGAGGMFLTITTTYSFAPIRGADHRDRDGRRNVRHASDRVYASILAPAGSRIVTHHEDSIQWVLAVPRESERHDARRRYFRAYGALEAAAKKLYGLSIVGDAPRQARGGEASS